MSSFKKIPIEIYSILLPSFLLFLYFSYKIFEVKKSLNIIYSLKNIRSLFITGTQSMNLMFVFLWIIITIYIGIRLTQKKNDEKVWSGIKSLLSINIFIGITSMILGGTLVFLFTLATKMQVSHDTSTIDHLERLLFGGLPATPLINIFSGTFFEYMIIKSYENLSTIVLFVSTLTILIDKNIFKKLLISFFVAFIISIPIFNTLKVVSPDVVYEIKKININNENLNDIRKSQLLDNKITEFRKTYTNNNEGFFAISSIPSLHAAWGIIIVLILLSLKNKTLGILSIFWQILNALGTFYTLQHYALDTIAGIILGLFSYYLAGLLIKIEKKYYTGFDFYSVGNLFDEMRERIKSII